jgi:hypothetical protein
MNGKILLASLFLTATQTGCAVYTGVSMTSQIATGKSAGEHAASALTGADCSAWLMLTDNSRHSYWCEVRDVSRTYNRNAY